MEETGIPWGLLGMLFGVLILALIVVFVFYAQRVRRRARQSSPWKDYIYRPQSTRKVRE